ncbi:hypothetical protein [Dysgonomonas sp. ZJ709]|uniref:hypothetical protein n=1 Tax=Dysgonomonas sp. ZJ709 TaxID=2709797 RepID=UPI0013E9CE1A|nr:hypothetical protein [Dysgonomonas sp. ZJ709]
MEMDELKNSWQALTEKLEKQEMLKETIIKKMLQEKTSKSLNKLVNMEMLGLVVILLFLPFIVYVIESSKISELYTHFMCFLLFICVLVLVWVVIKLRLLMKIDLNKDIKHNVLCTNRFNLYIRREKFMMYLIIPILFILCAIVYASLNAPVFLWVFLGCVFLLCITGVLWQYKKIYDKNINSILKSLDELKELEEEKD